MHALGLDIGTTSISACVIDIESKEPLIIRTIKNPGIINDASNQNPDVILDSVKSIIKQMSRDYPKVVSIGLTGQMHGILYTDRKFNAISPLYTWQDCRGDLIYRNAKTYAQELSDITGYKTASGYGAVTHYYNTVNRKIPAGGVKIITIHGYIAGKLCGNTDVPLHISDAAAIGLFDFSKNGFDLKAIRESGMDSSFFPDVKKSVSSIGKMGRVEIFLPVGDNQAVFTGSVKDYYETVSLNIGTGSQVSILYDRFIQKSNCETRPFNGKDYLIVGSSLCGGRSYDILEKFIDRCATLAGAPEERRYDIMKKIADNVFDINDRLEVETTFAGTRQNPDIRGSINNIGTKNFTPEHMVEGFLRGMIKELYAMYEEIKDKTHKRHKILAGSGNGIRKNPALRRIVSEVFEIPVEMGKCEEDAAFGAALSTVPDNILS